MNSFEVVDFAALSPLIILLIGALSLLLLESFEKGGKNFAFFFTLFMITLSILAAYFAPISQNPFLTPWLRFDSLGHFFTLFFLLIGLASTLVAYPFFQHFKARQGEYYFFLLATLFGLILIGSAADFLTLFIGLETLSIALYVMCGYMKNWEMSKEAAVKYFLIGSVATAFLLYGIALVYGSMGTTFFETIAHQFPLLSNSFHTSMFFSGIALVTLGLAFKAAIVPFHVWAPDVYDGAPTPVTAFMAVGTKVGAFIAFAILFLVTLPHFDPVWSKSVSFLAIITLLYANFVALKQSQLRRFFAYSGISHAGYLLIPVIVGSSEALPALVYYLVVYAIATMGSFAVLTFLDQQSKGVFLKDLKGLYGRSPFLAIMMTICLLTLAGIPPTVGFFAKFYIFKIAFQEGYYLLVFVGLLTAVISAFYYLRIVSYMFSDVHEEGRAVPFSWSAAIVAVVAVTSLLLFSFYPEPLIALITAM